MLCDSDEDPEKERLYVDVMRAEGVAGVILATTSQALSHIRNLLGHNIPVVAIDRRIKDRRVDSVLVANANGAFLAIEHLLGLGHRRISMVSMRSIPTGRERQAGYLRALRKYGVRGSRRLIRLGVPKPEGGYRLACELLKLKPRPTALFVDNNMMMLGALEAIRESGLSVPEELSVVGFDDMPWATLLHPPLTVVSQPTHELGRKAVENLLERIDHPTRPVSHLRLIPKLIIRESSGAACA